MITYTTLLNIKKIDIGNGQIKTKTIIPHYESFDEGLQEMKKTADIYLEKR